MNEQTPSTDAISACLHSAGGRIGNTARFVAELGQKLRAAGIPVDRLTTGIPILHPNISSSSALWEPGKEPTERR